MLYEVITANYPTLSNLQKINYKPNPEWRVTVENDEGDTVQLYVKNTYKLTQVQEFKTVLFEQALITAPTINRITSYNVCYTKLLRIIFYCNSPFWIRFVIYFL